MDHIGIDLGGRDSQVCVRNSAGAITEEARRPTIDFSFRSIGPAFPSAKQWARSNHPVSATAMKPRRGKTAAELAAELNLDPEFCERRRKQQEEADAVERAAQVAERPLVEALHEAGLGWARSVWDLVNTAAPYPEVLDILFDHIQKDYPPKILEGIGRALAVPESRRFWNKLLMMFRNHPDGAMPNKVKWSIGCALAASATEDVIEDVVAFVDEPRHGENRAVFLKALAASGSLKARAALEAAARDLN